MQSKQKQQVALNPSENLSSSGHFLDILQEGHFREQCSSPQF